MRYVSLKKMYHIDQKRSDELYLQRFLSESSKKLSIYINGYECFYMINEEILNLITRIYDLNMTLMKKITSSHISSLGIEYLKLRSLVEEIRSSNKMEGIYSTKKEIYNLIHASSNKKNIRFYGQIKKYLTLEEDNDFFIHTSSDIRSLYEDVLSHDIDENNKLDGLIFRKGGVEITSGSKTLHNGVSGEGNIIEMMDKALSILNQDNINILIRIALFHYLFEYIHPFYDGNGRMGRFISCGYLSNKFHILTALQLSIGCLHNRKKYYEAFSLSSDIRNKGDLTVFIIMFLEIYLSGLEELKENIDEIIDNYIYNKGLLKKIMNEKEFLLCDYILEGTLFTIEPLTMKELEKITNLSHVTIKNTMNTLNKKYPIITINEDHKPYRYSIDIEMLYKIANK